MANLWCHDLLTVKLEMASAMATAGTFEVFRSPMASIRGGLLSFGVAHLQNQPIPPT